MKTDQTTPYSADTCACGHSREEHHRVNGCEAVDDSLEGGEEVGCDCIAFEPEEGVET